MADEITIVIEQTVEQINVEVAEFTIPGLISSDAGNTLELGSDKKLYVQANAGGESNLSLSKTKTTNIVANDNGTGFTLGLANGTDAGVTENNFTDSEKTKLSNVPADTNTALSLKLDASAYNDRFKGKFTTLLALQTAYPTASAGDYAQVDAGSGSNVKNYNYDLEEGWVEGSSTPSASNTDELPEGSINLYFTTARVLATLLSGLSLATGGAIVSTDSVLVAFGKLQKQINDLSSVYQAILVSGTNIKTLNNESLLGSGNISVLTMIGKEFSMTMPGSTAFNGLGNYIFNVAGTADNIYTDFSSSNKFLQTIRRRYVSAGTAGSSVQFGDTSFRKLAIGYNYTSIFIFGNEDASTVANARCFHGYSNIATIGNINPSTLTNCFGVGADSGDVNLQIIHNDTTGTATKIDLGSGFPANTNSDDFYFIKYDLQTNGNVIVYVKNLKTGAESTTTITTDLPVSTQGLFAASWRNNGGTALPVRLSLIHWSNVRNSY